MNSSTKSDKGSCLCQELDYDQHYQFQLMKTIKNCILTKKPNVKFCDIAGNNYAKQCIEDAFILPTLVDNFFDGKFDSWNKILLYGPPGVGKTMMAQALANEIKATVFWVSMSDITSKFIGESEKLLRILFELAKQMSPSIIIIDEMDSIGRKRNGTESETERRIKTEFLKLMDEINDWNEKVFVLATTNIPWELDVAALRRFERKILLPMPDKHSRSNIFKYHLEKSNQYLTEDDYQQLAIQTEGYSGYDINLVVKESLIKQMKKLKESLSKTLQEESQIEIQTNQFELHQIQQNVVPKQLNILDIQQSIKNCKPACQGQIIELYNKFLLKYGHIEQKQDITTNSNQKFHQYFL